MTKVSRYIRTLSIATSAVLICMSMLTSCAQKESIKSNKRERNAIKAGNKLYDKKKYTEAIKSYDDAIEANPSSDRAAYNRALSVFMSGKDADSTMLSKARESLKELVDNASDPEVREYALYTLGNDAVYIGDELAKISKDVQKNQPVLADSLNRLSIASYKQAIHNYEEFLRRKPGDIRVMQNLRITQLKLPPEEEKPQQQQQQPQQPQPQPQKQQQKQQDQALKALERRELITRQKKGEPQQPRQPRNQPDKPW